MLPVLKFLSRLNLSLSRPIVLSTHRNSSTLTTTPFYSEVLSNFPAQRCLVFAYGSEVFRQEGHKDTTDNMTDFIFAVHDTELWHKENLDMHPSHYSTMGRLMGPAAIRKCQEEWGARLYFNTLVPWGKGMIKYGVISKNDLLIDLKEWETLYVAGRLHKPVNIIEQEEDMELKKTLKTNLNYAIHAALLLLPEKFGEEELFLTVAGLSYTGDFRMVVGEDRNKVANIVRPQMDRFRELYKRRMLEVTPHLHISLGGGCVQDMSSEGRVVHLARLPSGVRDKVLAMHTIDKNNMEVEEVLKEVVLHPSCSQAVAKAVGQVVAGVDKPQAVKGILTAEWKKAVIYSWAKVHKMVKSWRRDK